MLDNYWQDFQSWARHPLKKDGNVVDWFLFVGLVLIAAWLWSRVIKAILE